MSSYHFEEDFQGKDLFLFDTESKNNNPFLIGKDIHGPYKKNRSEKFLFVKESISSEKQTDLILEKSTHNLFAEGPEHTFIFENVLTFLNENSTIS